MGLLTQGDAKLYRNWFREMAKLRGFTVKYQYILESAETIHSEINPEVLSDPMDLDVIYEDNPTRNTLRNIGWVSETPDDKPYIMMFPMNTPNITVEARVTVPSTVELMKTSKNCKLFKITSIYTLFEYPDCYVCTIVPVFKNDAVKDNYTETNYNYIHIGENDD